MLELPFSDDRLVRFIEQCDTLGLRDSAPTLNPYTEIALVVALQPHPDDVALSIGGIVSALSQRVHLITLFSNSGDTQISKERIREDSDFAQLINGQYKHLDLHQGDHRENVPDPIQFARALKDNQVFGEQTQLLIGPASVSRHADHIFTQHVARSLACQVYWEDVAFWAIYGSSVEDRMLFSLRSSSPIFGYTLVAVDISQWMESKARMLRCYPSQSKELWRPLRYAWTAARGGRSSI